MSEVIPHSLGSSPLSWEEIKDIVKSNTLQRLYRSPEMMEKYQQRKDYLKDSNQSVFKFLLSQQLNWLSDDQKDLPDKEIIIKPKSNKLFGEASDLKIVMNEFPYYFEQGVDHIVIWTKLPILPDPNHALGDITNETRQIIDLYVNKTFIQYLGLPKENVLWFRNWSALQSVKGISHIHVLVKGLSRDKLNCLLNTSGKVLGDEDLGKLKL